MGRRSKNRIKSTHEILKEMDSVVKMCLSKVKYHSEYEVSLKADEITRTGTPMYYYRCPNCQAFHLTRTPRYDY